jgi:hypothetical protein
VDQGVDYDDAYHEAKRIFLKLFSENEDFLVPEMMNDDVKDENGEQNQHKALPKTDARGLFRWVQCCLRGRYAT